MASNVSLNGVTYVIPATGESSWGTQVSAYLVALGSGVLSKAGGSFTLTADADFGANYGLKSIYYKSRGTVSTAGIVRVANDESIGWRNAANSDNKLLKVNSSNLLEFDGSPIAMLGTGSITSAQLAAALTDETGTGVVVFATSPTLITPVLGAATATSINSTTIPSSKTLVVTTDKLSALAATTSAELAGVISDETGSGPLVFANTPTLVTPVLGVATATSINKVAITAPATSATLAPADGSSLSTVGAYASIFRFSGATDITFPTSGTLAANSNATASAAGIITSYVPVVRSNYKEINDAAYTILDADGYDLVYATTTLTASRTVTLPTLADNLGRTITIKNLSSAAAYQILVVGEGAETIDGYADWPLPIQGDYITVKAEAVGWAVVEKNTTSRWVSFTPSNSWTTNVSSNTGTYRRNGQNLEVKVRMAFSGQPDSGGLVTTLPNSWAIDTSLSFADAWDQIGAGTTNDSSAQYYTLGVYYASSTTVSLLSFNITGTFLAPAAHSRTVPFTIGSSDYVQYKFDVPISGWRA